MRIVVFGSNGRLGSKLVEILKMSGNEVFGFNRMNFDLNNFMENQTLGKLECDLAINTIALTNVDSCELNPNLAKQLNSDFPLVLAKYCENNQIKLIHISTDYVFSGNGQNFYNEYSTPEPICYYGISKLQGEINVLKHGNENNLVVRTAWLFDTHSKNFLTWFLNEIKISDKIIRVIKDQFGSPTSTHYVAQRISEIIDFDLSNIIHITNNGKTSWYNFALEVATIMNLDKAFIKPITSKELNRIAPRPINTSMNSSILPNLAIARSTAWELELNSVLGRFTG